MILLLNNVFLQPKKVSLIKVPKQHIYTDSFSSNKMGRSPRQINVATHLCFPGPLLLAGDAV